MREEIGMLKYLAPIELEKHVEELAVARAAIGELKGTCYGLPNPRALLWPLVLREALKNSGLKTATTLEKLLQAQWFNKNDTSLAEREVWRYMVALETGLNAIRKRILDYEVINEVHAVLVGEKDVGMRIESCFREAERTGVRNRMGFQGAAGYLEDLERFINIKNGLDPLVKTIIVQYQIQTVGVFREGNRRMGKILMALCLVHYHLLDLPVLFMEDYLDRQAVQYSQAIHVAEKQGDFNPLIRLMLEAIGVQAKISARSILEIRNLRAKLKAEIRKGLPKIYTKELIDAIFSQPLITPTKYAELMGCTRQTATAHLKALKEIGMMEVVQAGKYTFYANARLMRYLNGERK